MAREIKIFLVVITGLCVLLIGLYMQANDRREARLDKYLVKKLDKIPDEGGLYVDIDPANPIKREERVVTKVNLPPVIIKPETNTVNSEAPAVEVPRRPLIVEQTGQRFADEGNQKKKKAARAKRTRIYIVKKGDTLSEIASRELGSAKLYMKLFKANRKVLKKPSIVPIGAKLVLPGVPESVPEKEVVAVNNGRSSNQGARDRNLGAGGNVPLNGRLAGMVTRRQVKFGNMYRVGKGDTIYTISRKVYGDDSRVRAIMAANADIILNPRDLSVGTFIRLPR